jgi:predicted transcriptional regulator
MKKIIYSFFLTFTIINFVGCSDSYDQALDDTAPITIKEQVEEVVDNTKDTAKEHNVTLSESTEQSFADLNDTLSTIENDVSGIESINEKVDKIISQTTEAIESVKKDIEDSNISGEEKLEALAKLEELQATVERDQFKEGLTAYTETLTKGGATDCSTDNTGTLPPAVPSDECL